MLEERLQIIEGSDSHELDVADLYLVPNVVLPTDFKTPKFEKYRGKLLPSRAPSHKGRVKTWRDLAEAFLRQYKYNKDMALD
ncbi:hypothetical protein CR513_10910, partial [Mucuna pruriens]